jgi:Carboxymuconolactone decarboxylase family
MNMPSDAPRRYRIVFRGECGHVFADVPGDVTIESRDGYTCLVATVRDQSEFYGLLDRFEDLALLPVSIGELGPGRLDARSYALIRLVSFAARGGEPAAVREHVMAAAQHGVWADEIAEALGAVLPTAVNGQIS